MSLLIPTACTMQPLILLLFIGTVHVLATPVRDATSSESADDDKLLATIYKKCWIQCDNDQGKKASQEALLDMISKKNIKHSEYCKPYLSARECANSCVSQEDHLVYLKPFYRRNYLNEFICKKNADEFVEFLPCYQNRTNLEFFFDRCGYFALSNTDHSTASKVTCNKLACVLKLIPKIVKNGCIVDDDETYAIRASDLMERLVAAFLRERVRLTKLQRLCEEMQLL